LAQRQPADGAKYIYIAFSMIDGNGDFPNGVIFGYNAQNFSALGYPLIYETTPGVVGNSGLRGGIWQGAAGLAAGPDKPGGSDYFIYTSAGDGSYDLSRQSAPNMDAGDSIVKLTPSLTYPSGAKYSDYSFTPSDSEFRQCWDLGYRSAGVMLLPDMSLGKSYAVKADKENYLWTTYRTSLGGYTGSSGCGTCSYPGSCGTMTNPCTPCNVANPNLAEPPIAFRTNHALTGPQSRSTPAFWSGMVSSHDQGELYFAVPAGQMNRYPVSSSCTSGNPPICNAAVSTNVDPTGSGIGFATTPSVSSNTATAYNDGIVWAIKSGATGTPPVLFAFRADTLSELYDTQLCHPGGTSYPDQPGTPTKFSVPTVANGHVYIATQTDFDIYGQLATRNCN
jgi:hypothetical protein